MAAPRISLGRHVQPVVNHPDRHGDRYKRRTWKAAGRAPARRISAATPASPNERTDSHLQAGMLPQHEARGADKRGRGQRNRRCRGTPEQQNRQPSHHHRRGGHVSAPGVCSVGM